MGKSEPGYWENRSITVKFSVGIGLLVCLMMIIAATGYMALSYVHNAHDAIGVRTTIQRLVFTMDRELEKARQLQVAFFRKYPIIGLKKAHEIYAQPSVLKTARAVGISKNLKKIITKTQVSDALKKSNIDLNLYLSSAKRFADTSIESFELVTRLASPETGREAQLDIERTLLRKKLTGVDPLLFVFHEMEDFIDQHRVNRERHIMQSAFNMSFILENKVRVSPELGRETKTNIFHHLTRINRLGEQILSLDAAIAAKFRDFTLQKESADTVSEYLIRLAKQGVDASDQKISQTHKLAIIVLALVTLLGFLGALVIAVILNNSITLRNESLTQEVRDRKRAEQRFRLAAQSISDLIYEWNIHDDTLIWFGDIDRALGYPPNSFPRTLEAWKSRIHPDDEGRVENSIKKHRVSFVSIDYEYQIQMKDGTWRCWADHAVPVPEDDGGPGKWIGTCRDITEKKQAESEKQKLEEQLRQSHKMEAIGTLAGGIAHDFNNILSAIMGYAELAQIDIPASSKSRSYVDQVLKASIRAKELVRRILSFSRKRTDERVPVQIKPIAKEILKLLRAGIPTTIDIQENIDIDDSIMLADPTQIHQVIMNLATNAAQSMELAGGVLSVTITSETIIEDQLADPPFNTMIKSGKYVKLTVSDTGSGIDPVIMDKIFDPYFTTKETGKGSGVGLAVVHGIVTANGGAVCMESQLGRGTSFHVYFPRAIHGLESVGPVVSPDNILPTGGEHILIVDDEKSLVDINETKLRRLGYQVTATTRSRDALEIFRSTPKDFDLVITDQTMPGMTGQQLAGRLLTIRPDIPILLCTGYYSSSSKKQAEELGIRGFIMKPIQHQVFAETVRSILDG